VLLSIGSLRSADIIYLLRPSGKKKFFCRIAFLRRDTSIFPGLLQNIPSRGILTRKKPVIFRQEYILFYDNLPGFYF